MAASLATIPHDRKEQTNNMMTILEIAIAKGAKRNEDGSLGMGEFDALDLPFFAGCEHCEASLGPAQSFPSTSGYIRCKQCITTTGFTTVEEFDDWCKRNYENE